MNLYSNIEYQIDLLVNMIGDAGDELYSISWDKSSSVGAHVRHVIEYLNILTQVQEGEKIDYASRKRNMRLEIDGQAAVKELRDLKLKVRRQDLNILVFDGGDTFKSSYLRELLYQHEHIVHHCAIIKLLLTNNSEVKLDPCFGYAKSTMAYMKTAVSL